MFTVNKPAHKHRMLRERSIHKLSKQCFSLSFKLDGLQRCERVLEQMGLECFGNLTADHIVDLYYAKCQDLELDPSEDQMKRFVNFCRLNMKSRKVKLRDCGFGAKCADVFARILARFEVCTLDLRK